MSETLVIRLRAAEDAPASWLIVDSNGAASGTVQSGPVADAFNLSVGRRVLLLLPGSEITLAAPELPLRGGAKLVQAVPFALEEQLASDVDGMHFAVGSRKTTGAGTPVAAISRGLMSRWHDACEAAGIQPSASLADSMLVPVIPHGCSLLLDETTLYVRRADGLPYALDAEPLAEVLDLAMGEAANGGENITFYTTPATYEKNRDLIEGLREKAASLQVKLLPDGPLPLLAAQAVHADGVNLSQGPYAPTGSIGKRLRPWRLPAGLAAATLAVFLIGQGLSLWRMSAVEKQLDARIAKVFAEALPGQPMVDARAQMEGILGSGGTAQGAMLPAVAVLAQALSSVPNTHIEALSFRGDALDLRVVAPSVEALDSVKKAMSNNGVTVELQSAAARGEVVEGRMQVRLGSA
jgi:general secretion pathway protein L